MEPKKVKKNQKTNGYGKDKRPEIENLEKKEITITETTKKAETKENSK